MRIPEEWKDWFEPQILKRGRAYYEKGAVIELDWEDDTLSALVEGSEDYEVEIAFEDGQVKEINCTCPYAEDGFCCKHMAAALYAAQELEPPKEESATPLQDLVASLREEDAKMLLLQAAQKDRDLAAQIRRFVTGKVPEEQLRAWRKKISRLARQFESEYGYDYGEEIGCEWGEEIVEVLDQAVPPLLETSAVMDAFGLVRDAFTQAWDLDVEDPDCLTELFVACKERWERIIQAATPAQRREMHTWFAEAVQSGRYGGAEELYQVLFKSFTDRELMVENILLLDQWIDELTGEKDAHERETLIQYRLELMDALPMSRQEKAAYTKRHFSARPVREYLIQEADRAQNYEEELRLLRVSRDMEERPGRNDGYSQRIIALLTKMGRTEELRAELLDHLRNRRQKDLQYVDQLKGLTPAQDWPTLREELLETPGLAGVWGELMIQEGLFRRLLDHVLATRSEWLMDRYETVLKEQFPQEVLSFYLTWLRGEMAAASNRKVYAQLAERLKRCRTYPEGEQQTEALAREWRSAYPRRSAMVEELRRAGF